MPGKIAYPGQAAPLIRGIDALVDLADHQFGVHGVKHFLFKDAGEVRQEMTGLLQEIGARQFGRVPPIHDRSLSGGRCRRRSRCRSTRSAGIEVGRRSPIPVHPPRPPVPTHPHTWAMPRPASSIPGRRRSQVEQKVDLQARTVDMLEQRLDVSSVYEETDSSRSSTASPSGSNRTAAMRSNSMSIRPDADLHRRSLRLRRRQREGDSSPVDWGAWRSHALTIWTKALGTKSAYGCLAGVPAMVPGRGRYPQARH